MAAEYTANALQSVALNQPVVMDASIPCRRGFVYHEDGTGLFVLRGITDACYATYQAVFNGNIAIPEGGTVGPIAIAITVNGEVRPTSKAILTPAAAQDFGNVTSTCIIRVPRGCCFSLAVDYIAADPAVTPAAAIDVQNANLVINRI